MNQPTSRGRVAQAVPDTERKARERRANALDRAAKVVGNKSRLAALLKVSRGAVTNWIARGIPAERCPDIELLTRAAGHVVTCEELCPEVAWHVVRANPLH